MSVPKRGLGRGLAALLGDAAVPVASSAEVVREIPVAEIRPNPFQPRKRFDAEALDELKASIAEYGVLVPIIVRRREQGYELIAGERRWRVCAQLQRPTIPALVRSSDDRQTLEFAIVENLQRENLNPLEEAAGFAYLIDEYGLTQEEVARRLGKSRPAVANTLRLLSLSEPLKAMLFDGRLSAGHARALLAAPEPERGALAERAVSEGTTVRGLERMVAGLAAPPARSPLLRPLSPDERDFEARLREKFGTHVAIVRYGRGGRIELRFSDDAELARLGDLLV
ncbi:MAG: ParB/RepB/Spo0J family partition protein [Candidatus Eremiobacteraeota bacterium]|nr:ParB/RepB/Spo0J family partition protein [Candidatus Eremiobacteraeota bacterium]MBV8497868.1 ParB/RepB/Spo0J family partition protein [Candidatus Eremiobacteraeota bacterium]